MNLVGCGTQCQNGWQSTSQPIVYPLTLTYGYIALAGSQSTVVLDMPNRNDDVMEGIFFTYITVIESNSQNFFLFNTETAKIESQWRMPTLDKIHSVNARYLNHTYITSSTSYGLGFRQFGIADLTTGICRYIRIVDRFTQTETPAFETSQIIDDYIYFLGTTHGNNAFLVKTNQSDLSQNNWNILTKTGISFWGSLNSFKSQTQPNIIYHTIQTSQYQSNKNMAYIGMLQEDSSNLLNSYYQVKQQWALTYPTNSYLISAGVYANDDQISIAYFSASNGRYLEYASITTINITDTGNFQAQSEIFYSAQNGFQIQFVSFNFDGIGRGVLGGTLINGKLNQLYYYVRQGVAIDLPEPYYFSMGTPYLVGVQILPVTDLQISIFNTGTQRTNLTTFTDLTPNNTYYDYPTNNIKVNSPIYLTYRSLTIPPFTQSYEYFLGDIALKIDLPECIYNQSCSDAVLTHKVLFDNMTSIPQDTLKFIPSTRSLYVQSKDLSVVGDYNLVYKCNLQDGFSQTQTLTVKITWDGRDLNPPPIVIIDDNSDNSSNSSNNGTVVVKSNYQPNYAPLFYEKPRDIVIISGRSAFLTLPEYYDPNPNDKVTIKFETVERYKTYFRLINQNTLQFDAGFTELGDKQLIITLRDNNKNPKESKYLITATFLQSDIEEMENTYVSQVNLKNSTQYIKAFENQKQITINKVTPDGKLELSFEKSLNITNKTQAMEQVKKALLLSFQDTDIQFDWDIIDMFENKITIQINFRNPLLISSQQVSSLSSLQVHDIGKNIDEYSIGKSWLVYRNQNKSICNFRVENASLNTFE
eukprot:403337843